MAAYVHIYTDGSADTRWGKGGTGALLQYFRDDTLIAELRVAYPYRAAEDDPSSVPTNNALEVRAAIDAIRCLNAPIAVTLFSDSKYLVEGWNNWLPTWLENGWQTSKKQPVANQHLWEWLIEEIGERELEAGYSFSIEHCDRNRVEAAHTLATAARKTGEATRERSVIGEPQSPAPPQAPQTPPAPAETGTPQTMTQAETQQPKRYNNRASTVRIIAR